MSTELHGPFESHRVTVGGYKIPRLTVTPLGGESDGLLNAILDERFCVCCDRDELDRWAQLVAHAMAIGAGFTCHGENSQPANPFRTQMLRIDSKE